MKQFKIPDIEIPPETQTLLRRQFASKALPGGKESDTFISQSEGRHEIRCWADALWVGVQAIYRIGVSEERKKTVRLSGLANLDQALRIIMDEVKADSAIKTDDRAMELARRAYKLGVAQAELKAAQPTERVEGTYTVRNTLIK